ncbi:MAG: GHMP kinase [Planctomycetes bacterium]|nr:GHMP kinase [Planctomycetota bacterium]
MEIIRQRASARAGLIGNPSDGYYGKTISVVIPDFHADVILYEWEQLELVLSQEDRSRFDSIQDLARDVRTHGYYGGIRLVKATIKKFVEYCEGRHPLHDGTFSVRYESNIPRCVGLAGSSAIIVATLRALMNFYHVEIPLPIQPSLALSVETEELGITAGLQDRVIQVYEGMVYMDFAQESMRDEAGYRYGVYERLDPTLLPPLYLAFSEEAGEPTEISHTPLRARYEQGDPEVHAAMKRFAELTVDARQALLGGDAARLSRLIDENFDLRRSIVQIRPEHIRMVETARAAGASAKFAGSGGAIIGVCPVEAFPDLKKRLGEINCQVLRPTVRQAPSADA